MHERSESRASAAVVSTPRSAPPEASGGLRRLHWFVVTLSLVLTLIAWVVSTRALEQRNAQRFGRQADKVIAQFVEQLQRHADVLAAAAGLVMASDEVTGEEWQTFAATLDLETQFPALSGIGVAYRVPAAKLPAFIARQRVSRPDFALHPAGERPVHLPLVHVTPARLAPALLGFDLAHEPRRREAAARAAGLGTAQLTAPVTPTGSETPGVVMLVPFYRGGPGVSPERRTERFAGAVVASMLLKNVAAGTLDTAARQIRVRIADGAAPLYDEIGRADEDLDPEPLYTLERDVPVHGRLWRVDVHSTLAFRRDANPMQPILVLLGGLSIDGLLFALLLLHSRAEGRLLRAANDLHDERTALAQSNEKLEAFACVASHDLKAPLLGIRTLVGCIEEDLDDYLRSEAAVPDVARNLARVERQAARADALIEGILDYSGLGTRSESPERVDTRAMLEEIREMLDVAPGQLVPVGAPPVFETCATRLRQVLANLIGNAFKYHHDVARARVRVEVEASGAFYRFSVSDDGPGIDARLHERIFEPFDTGWSESRTDSTGVGLAIVRKSVETMGGTISVDSAPGRGATFTFDWPAGRDAVDVRTPDSDAERDRLRERPGARSAWAAAARRAA